MKACILSASVLLGAAALASATPQPVARPDPLHVPLRRRTGKMSLEKLRAHADFMRAKYGYNTVANTTASRAKRAGNSAGISIIDQVCRHINVVGPFILTDGGRSG